MARASVLAWVREAVVDVQLAVLSLEALGALALVRADQVLAHGAVLARGRLALVDLLLAVRAGVPVEAVAAVRVADVVTCAVVTELLEFYTWEWKECISILHYTYSLSSLLVEAREGVWCL